MEKRDKNVFSRENWKIISCKFRARQIRQVYAIIYVYISTSP